MSLEGWQLLTETEWLTGTEGCRQRQSDGDDNGHASEDTMHARSEHEHNLSIRRSGCHDWEAEDRASQQRPRQRGGGKRTRIKRKSKARWRMALI